MVRGIHSKKEVEAALAYAERNGWRVQGGKAHDNVEMVWRFVAPKCDARVRIRRLDSGPAEIRRLRIVSTIDGSPAVNTTRSWCFVAFSS